MTLRTVLCGGEKILGTNFRFSGAQQVSEDNGGWWYPSGTRRETRAWRRDSWAGADSERVRYRGKHVRVTDATGRDLPAPM